MDEDLVRRVAELEARVAALEATAGTSVRADASPEVRDLVSKGRLVSAIKVYRRESGAGLREAKKYIDSLAGR